MNLQWDALKNITEYEALIDGVVSHITTGISIIVDGLEPGTTYKVKARGRQFMTIFMLTGFLEYERKSCQK